MISDALVVDASVVFKILIPEKGSSEVSSFFANNTLRLLAPVLLNLEIANALWKRVKLKDMDLQDALGTYQLYLQNFEVELCDAASLTKSAMSLAENINHDSIYDCLYLALALKMGVKLLTADIKFIKRLSNTEYKNVAVTI